MPEAGEEWRTVLGTSGRYSVSSLGRVRSEVVMSADTQNSGPRRGNLLIAKPDNRGYARFTVRMPDGKQHTLHVHSLVAAAFVGIRPDGMTINHKDGVKTNNRADNLEYVTPSENSRHAVALGLMAGVKGEKHYKAKLNVEQVKAIREQYTGRNLKDLASAFGVSKATICRVAKRQSYANV